MKTWRLLDTGPLPGALNMNIDKAILKSHDQGKSPPTLRFYQWSPPAISLGYFQKQSSIDISKCHQFGLDIVKRPTGGKAVLHENDLTYSIVAGTKDGVPFSVPAAYHLLSQGLIAGFKKLGVEPEAGHVAIGASDSDICFMRFAAGDLLCQGKKFMGNAQTWKRSSLLQHGAIILEPQVETWAMIFSSAGESGDGLREKMRSRVTSLNEILGRKVDPDEVKDCLIDGISHALGMEFQTGKLSPEEWVMARELCLMENKEKHHEN
jgi:lipoyl(octanoyl) transferase